MTGDRQVRFYERRGVRFPRLLTRLFSAISSSWRARPLTSHEVVIETIRATTTTTGLTVKAELDLGTYEKGIKISDQQIKNLETTQLHRHEFHGDWNYTMCATRRDDIERG